MPNRYQDMTTLLGALAAASTNHAHTGRPWFGITRAAGAAATTTIPTWWSAAAPATAAAAAVVAAPASAAAARIAAGTAAAAPTADAERTAGAFDTYPTAPVSYGATGATNSTSLLRPPAAATTAETCAGRPCSGAPMMTTASLKSAPGAASSRETAAVMPPAGTAAASGHDDSVGQRVTALANVRRTAAGGAIADASDAGATAAVEPAGCTLRRSANEHGQRLTGCNRIVAFTKPAYDDFAGAPTAVIVICRTPGGTVKFCCAPV